MRVRFFLFSGHRVYSYDFFPTRLGARACRCSLLSHIDRVVAWAAQLCCCSCWRQEVVIAFFDAGQVVVLTLDGLPLIQCCCLLERLFVALASSLDDVSARYHNLDTSPVLLTQYNPIHELIDSIQSINIMYKIELVNYALLTILMLTFNRGKTGIVNRS